MGRAGPLRQIASPGTRSRGFLLCPWLGRAKASICAQPIVQAELEDMHGLLKGAGGSDGLRRRKGEADLVLAEIKIVVLDLPGPIRREGVFDSGPDGPTPSRLGRGPAPLQYWIRVRAGGVLLVHPSRAALGVEERAVDRDAEAGGDRPECRALGGASAILLKTATAKRRTDTAAIDVGPACVGFEAEHRPA